MPRSDRAESGVLTSVGYTPEMKIAVATSSDHPNLIADERSFVRALAGRGIEPVPAVWDDPTVDWASFRACLIRNTWDYTRKYDAFVEWIRRLGERTCVLNPAPVVLWNSHKSYLQDLASDGVAVPPLELVPRGAAAELRDVIARRPWESCVIKPAVGAGARRTNVFHVKQVSQAEAAESFLRESVQQSDTLVQQFVPEVASQGELSLIYFDREFSHAVCKTPKTGDFRCQEKYGGALTAIHPSNSLIAWGRAVCAAVERRFALRSRLLFARVDLIERNAGGPELIELELIEPELFLRTAPTAGARLAECVCRAMSP